MRNMLHAAGPINSMLENLGLISDPLPFLTDALAAKITVIAVNMWVGIPFTIMIVTSVLTNLPEDQLEAARIDGAREAFNVIYLLTGGAPMNSNYYAAGDTDLLVTWLYKLTVEKADYNLASTIGIITFVVCAVFSLIAYTRSAAYNKEDMFQ